MGDFTVDFDRNGNIIGVEVMNASEFFSSVNIKKELIKANPNYGEPVAKKLFPTEYVQKYGITNLFRVELPVYWRMLYTLTDGDSEVEIIAFVLDVIDVIDHKEYDGKFGYRGI